MKHKAIKSVMLAAALMFSADLTLAADKAPATGEARTVTKEKAADKSSKGKSAKSAAKVKLMDINGASKAELKTLPGISDAEADKIIAGRPYLSKARLVTQDVVTRETYDGIRTLVIAKQGEAAQAKLKELEKKR